MQAAIGSVPLAAGLACGKIVLSVAVLAIIITAPLGAIGMDAAYQRLLGKGKLKKIFRKYFGRKCVIVIAEKRK